MEFTELTLTVADHVAEVTLNRPGKANALDASLWTELKAALEWCDRSAEVRVVVLAGAGKHFCSGIDISLLAGLEGQLDKHCEGRKRERLRELILELQSTVNSLEKCRKPVIAAIHGACVGGGLDVALAADFRYASRDAQFSVREVAMGMVADVGSLQRLPGVVGQGIARELAYTARDVDAGEALCIGLVNRVLDDIGACRDAALSAARQIAAQSPLAVRGSKQILNYSRDHSVADGLDYVATWNAAMLLSEDIQEAIGAQVMGRPASFRD
ncbi:crotonase/enoyl-CoA hydratase family protein [Crenobacter sp. SG2303]|uniref:Crotonase/enoyl-CoA hydratase family protein n=1 Tax=Crenobacter oryzisoli TaxID=3056844 RepID=A0ABT7XT11_9NEIS|nr:crotonase/enoyl-CoA hydratase family protein [Crenobacter sp. SG2303]MDN0076870.1 crotonase/enoyl-CoA hydratase family protein [Crenobacter sp. SG2303]